MKSNSGKSAVRPVVCAEPLEPRRLFTAVQIRYDLAGDVNDDGIVDAVDFTSLAALNRHENLWSLNDFNYDGKVNSLDFNSIATNFGQLLPVAPTPLDGDATGDGVVDTRDFTRVISHLGNHTTSVHKGDVNHDGRVSEMDVVVVYNRYGHKGPPG